MPSFKPRIIPKVLLLGKYLSPCHRRGKSQIGRLRAARVRAPLSTVLLEVGKIRREKWKKLTAIRLGDHVANGYSSVHLARSSNDILLQADTVLQLSTLKNLWGFAVERRTNEATRRE